MKTKSAKCASLKRYYFQIQHENQSKTATLWNQVFSYWKGKGRYFLISYYFYRLHCCFNILKVKCFDRNQLYIML